CQHFWGSPWTF
nr:immunoglobulin light chain junction region [Mus musculus]